LLSRSWRLATVLAASSLVIEPSAMVCLGEQPTSISRLSPSRLPGIDNSSIDNSSVDGPVLGTGRPGEQTASADLDALVESWFSESPKEDSQTDQGNSSGSDRWLRSVSSTSAGELARRMVEQANREFQVGAWLSAETSAWDALRWAAESVDLAAREEGATRVPSALQTLHSAREAIRESRDFVSAYGPLDRQAIERLSVSHQSNLLDQETMSGLTATDAADRYLDHARVLLAPIAKDSVEAARSMDLLAAVYLRRNDAQSLPSATALCLRRAALQGQPGNASLAYRLGMQLSDLGLYGEARWALEHSLSLQPDVNTATALAQVLHRSGHANEAQRVISASQQVNNGPSRLVGNSQGSPLASDTRSTVQVPEIVELTPEEFAAISQPVMAFDQSERITRESRSVAAITASAPMERPTVSTRTPATPVDSDVQEVTSEKPNWFRRVLSPWKRVR
jgi:hypothetical protein